MVTIALNGMKFHSFHGYYAEEQSVGNNYEIDVMARAALDLDTLEDDLSRTINYEQVYQICDREMKKPVRLIETVGQNILNALMQELSSEIHFTISIRKMNPLLGGLVDYALIKIES